MPGEFIFQVWGAGIAKHFAIPYNRKLGAVPLQEMETSWLGGRVPLPDLEEMIEGALRPVPNTPFWPVRKQPRKHFKCFPPINSSQRETSTW